MPVRDQKVTRADGTTYTRWMVDFWFHDRETGLRKRFRRTLQEGTRKQRATELEAVFRREVEAGTLGKSGEEEVRPPRFDEFAERWAAVYCAANLKPSTARMYRSNLSAHLIPYFGKKRLDAISGFDIETLKAGMKEKGLKPKTVNNVLGTLQKLLRTAIDWQVVSTTPGTKPVQYQKPPIPYLSAELEGRILEAADPLWRPMITFALNTGLRRGELVGLRKVDVDLERRQAVVSRSVVRGEEVAAKHHRVRTVDLNSRAAEALRSAYARFPDNELVFPGPDGGHICDGSLKWPLSRIAARIGMGKLGWHTFRHSFATRLVERGASLPAIQALLGHSTITMTQRYVQLAPEAGKRAEDLLE